MRRWDEGHGVAKRSNLVLTIGHTIAFFEKYLLGKIEKQMVRLKDDSIDVCETCGEKIAFKRLMARPVTTLCIDCKEQNEREEAAVEQAGQGAGLDAGGLGELGVADE